MSRISISTITWDRKPVISRIIVEPPNTPQDLCSELVGDFKLAGCVPFVGTTPERDDVLGHYIPGGS